MLRYPCNECAKAIIQSGIKRVVFREDAYRKMDSGIAAERMFKAAGVEIIQQKSERYVKIKV